MQMKEQHWLEALHKDYYAMLVRLARVRLRNSAASTDDAEDIVQQAFVLAIEKDVCNHETPIKWLIRTVAYLCKNQAKRAYRTAEKQKRFVRQRMEVSPLRTPSVMDMCQSQTGEVETLLMCKQVLTPEEFELMWSYAVEQIPVEELCVHFAISHATLRVRIHRLRMKVRKGQYGQ